MKTFALAVSILLLAGCAQTLQTPSPAQLSAADYGTEPGPAAESAIKERFALSLFDPYSAQYIFSPPMKGWLNEPRGFGPGESAFRSFGWCVDFNLNAKNRFGAYVGGSYYRAFVLNDLVIETCDLQPKRQSPLSGTRPCDHMRCGM